jgi:methylated-DNA-[protein]-cysteine S-methyltransferase
MADSTPFVARVPSPIGTFEIVYDGRRVQVVDLSEPRTPYAGVPVGARLQKPPYPKDSPPRQLKEYFENRRGSFDLDIEPPTGTEFDRTVWKELLRIPMGSTITYGELARRAGYPGAARAVGGAVGRNPIAIIVPCHRVVGADETLTGYGMGLWRKKWLLIHERAWPLKSRSAEGPRPRGQRTLEEVASARAGKRPKAAAAAPSPAPVGAQPA